MEIIIVWIRCDNCEHGFRTGESIRELRKNAKKVGWKYQKGTMKLPSKTHIYGDYCPVCLDEFKNFV